MTMTKRTYTPIASTAAKCHLQGLLDSINRPAEYRTHMTVLGELLASYTVTLLPHQSNKETLIISTAEDADFLQRGVAKILHDQNIPTKLAVFGTIITSCLIGQVSRLLFISLSSQDMRPLPISS